MRRLWLCCACFWVLGGCAGTQELAPVIEAALADAAQGGVTGKDVTPFLLARVLEATGGRSLEANVALYLNNCRVAGAIAAELARLE